MIEHPLPSPDEATDARGAARPKFTSGGCGRPEWTLVLPGAAVSLVLYALLMLPAVPNMAPDAYLWWATPSYAGELFPWLELRTRESLLEASASLDPAEGYRSHALAAAGFLAALAGLFAVYGLTLRAVAGRRSRAPESSRQPKQALEGRMPRCAPIMCRSNRCRL